VYRLRLIFTRDERLKFIGQLDMARTWERAIRRAGLPLAYSHGFNPRPRMQFASALPLGCTGEAEVLDLWLETAVLPDQVARALTPVLPAGLSLRRVEPVPLKAPALPTQIVASIYRVTVEGPMDEAQARRRVADLLAADRIPRQRRGKTYDLRPLIESLEVVEATPEAVTLRMRLAAGDRGTGRPDEVLDALGWGDRPAWIHRERIVFR